MLEGVEHERLAIELVLGAHLTCLRRLHERDADGKAKTDALMRSSLLELGISPKRWQRARGLCAYDREQGEHRAVLSADPWVRGGGADPRVRGGLIVTGGWCQGMSLRKAQIVAKVRTADAPVAQLSFDFESIERARRELDDAEAVLRSGMLGVEDRARIERAIANLSRACARASVRQERGAA